MRLSALPVIAVGTGEAPRSAPTPDAPCIAIVPGTCVVCIAFPAPPRLRGSALDRVAFHALQDRLAMPVSDAVHVAARADTGDMALAVVAAAEQVSAWTAEAASAGWQPEVLLPDWLALAWCPGIWSLHASDGMVVARTGRLDGFTVEVPLAEAILAGRLARAAPHAVLLTGDAATTALLRNMLEASAVTLHTDPAGLGARRFAAHEADASLSGRSAGPLAALAGAAWPWRLPAGLAATAFVAWCATAALDTRRDLAIADAHAARAATAFRAIHGGAVPIVDMQLQTARYLEQLRAEGSADMTGDAFAPLLAMAEEGLSTARLRSLGWREDAGLAAEISVADFAALESLVARLRDTGLGVAVARADARDNAGVEATLNLALARGSR